jgi:hypothetical protein
LDNVAAGADLADELIDGSGAELAQVTAQLTQSRVGNARKGLRGAEILAISRLGI